MLGCVYVCCARAYMHARIDGGNKGWCVHQAVYDKTNNDRWIFLGLSPALSCSHARAARSLSRLLALSLACSLSRSRSRTRTRSPFLLPSLPSSLFPSLPRSLNLFAMLCISIYPCVRGSLPCMLAHVFTQVHTLTNTHTHTHTHTNMQSLSLSLSLSRTRFLSRARAVSLSFSRIDSHTHIHTNTHVYSLTHMDTNRGSWDRRDDLQH